MFLFVRQSFIKQNPHEKAATMQVTGAEEDWNSTEVLKYWSPGKVGERKGGGGGVIFAELREKPKGESLL